MSDLVAVVLGKLERIWHRKEGAAALCAIAFLLVVLQFEDQGRFPDVWHAAIAGAVAASIVLMVWAFTTRVTKTAADRIGVVVSICTETAADAIQLKNDFLRRMAEMLEASNANAIQLITLPRFASEQIEAPDDATAWLSKVRGHLIIWGTCGRRESTDGDVHVLRLRLNVRHAPIPKAAADQLSASMTRAVPQGVIIKSEDGFVGFQVSAGLYETSARYVLGMASYVSRDYSTAHGLFCEVEERLRGLPSEPTKEIADALPGWLYASLFHLMDEEYQRYFLTRNPAVLSKVEEIAQLMLARWENSYHALLAVSMCDFVLRRDVESAMDRIEGCSNNKDSTWRYSRAFLLAYSGDLEGANDEYKRAFRAENPNPTVPIQTEEFIADVLRAEPEKYQLLFCLGVINYKMKGDHQAAEAALKKFLQLCPNEAHPGVRKSARAILAKLVTGSAE